MDSQPGFDVATLDEWIGDRLPGRGGPLQATRMGEGTGEANALYWLRRAGHVWVLRRPPAVINAPGASDMNREWRILVALEGTAVPHPAPLLLGGPDSPLGTPFPDHGAGRRVHPGGRAAGPGAVIPAGARVPRLRAGRRPGGAGGSAVAGARARRTRRAGGVPGPAGVPLARPARRLPDPGHPRAGLARPAGWKPVGRRGARLRSCTGTTARTTSWRRRGTPAAWPRWSTGTPGPSATRCWTSATCWRGGPSRARNRPSASGTSRSATGCRPGRNSPPGTPPAPAPTFQALPYYQALALFKLAIILEGSVARWRGPQAQARAAMVNRLIRYAGLFAREERATVPQAAR